MEVNTNSFFLFPVERKNEKMPKYRLVAKIDDQFVDVGAVWEKQGKKGNFGSGQFVEGLNLVGSFEPFKKKEREVSDDDLNNLPF